MAPLRKGIPRTRSMAQIICIIGNKGGTGKTTLSHMLAQGLGLLGRKSACVLTDSTREPLAPDGRRYVTADARSRETLMGVIDGGGNRPEMDRKLYGLADIVILPFRDSHEDIRTVLRDLEMFPRAYALPSQWPGNAWQRTTADRQVARMMGAHRHRILRPVTALSATKLLLQKQLPDQLRIYAKNRAGDQREFDFREGSFVPVQMFAVPDRN